MKIAQVAPLVESIPPPKYGGTERAVAYLTDGLVSRGHEVTLFASGDSKTRARLVPMTKLALRQNGMSSEHDAYLIAGLEHIFQYSYRFDVIHFHTGCISFPLVRRSNATSLITVHGRLDTPGMQKIADEYFDLPFVGISRAQTRSAPQLNWIDVIPHGLPTFQYDLGRGDGGYLCFVGRISPEKGIEEAIEIATRAGMPLKIAAKVDPQDQAYFETIVKPLLHNSPTVEFVGEVSDREKNALIGGAVGLLFPTKCNESFGLVVIEAMACGTPVIAFANGAVPEIIAQPVTGFVCDSVDAAVKRVPLLPQLRRARIRECFEQRFSIDTTVSRYLGLYSKLVGEPLSERHTHSYLPTA